MVVLASAPSYSLQALIMMMMVIVIMIASTMIKIMIMTMVVTSWQVHGAAHSRYQ